MIYLSGHYRPELPAEVGVMNTPMISYALPRERLWAADTGCYSRPERYRDADYLNWLRGRAEMASTCLFACAPDVWGDGRATLKRSLPMLGRIRDAGYRAALVLQPGIRPGDMPWDEIDAVFVGGVDEWQNGPIVQAIVDEANERGKWTHRGRVNSLARLRETRRRGYDSADGTFVAFGPDKNIPRLRKWLAAVALQPHLPLDATELLP